MKLAFNSTQVIASDGMEVSKMGMDAESADIFTFYLRDKIYTKKRLAPIREYITNAWDEHVKYGIQKPVDVTINKVNNSYMWAVRDYAKGLSEHDVRTVFAMYGKSTKRNCNKQGGMFGLGSKSAMAYTDTFYITSNHEGVCTSYVATLGKGPSGVPVGEIYKVEEHPTTEQGIEVSFDITNDYYSFISETEAFVKSLSPDYNVIFVDNTRSTPETHQPAPSLGHVVKGEYTIHKYESDYTRNHEITIRMGGVVYGTRRMVHNACNQIVVDVPIGKLSIPISREGLEKTPQNDKILEEILKYIDELSVEDRATVPIPAFGKLRAESNQSSGGEGEWFDFNFKQSFPDSHKYYYHVALMDNPNTEILPVNGKYMIYVFPNIKNTKSWMLRLEKALKLIYPDYAGYMKCSKDIWEQMVANDKSSLNISDCVFVDIKALKLPKLEKGPTGEVQYQVHKNYGHKKSYTPQELDDYVTGKYFNGVETDDKWWEAAACREDIDARTIGLVAETSSNHGFWRANSKKMQDAMVELGWLTPNSPERLAKIAELAEKKRQDDLRKNASYTIKCEFWDIDVNPRTIKAVQSKPERVNKVKQIKALIDKENSTRSRVLQSIRSYTNLTRQDLRAVLKLK